MSTEEIAVEAGSSNASWVSHVSEREFRDAVEVRIGLVSDRHHRRLLRSVFADKERTAWFFEAPCSSHPWVRGCAERTVEVCRIIGAAAGSLPGVDRDLVTTAGIIWGMREAYREQRPGQPSAFYLHLCKGLDDPSLAAFDRVIGIIDEAELATDHSTSEAVVLGETISLVSRVAAMADISSRAASCAVKDADAVGGIEDGVVA